MFYHKDGFDNLPNVSAACIVKVASVASTAVKELFLKHMNGSDITPLFAQSSSRAAGVVNTYKDVSRLGVDRWLVAIAAYKREGRASLVIDIGSAINVELVTSSGIYLGGYIAPGIELMKRALLSDTGLVRFDDIGFSLDMKFGQSTVEAVSSGISGALVGLSKVAIDQATIRLETDFDIILTGGGASDIIPYLPKTAIEVPELVMDGLRWLMP